MKLFERHHHMVFKKSFKLLVATEETPFFAVFQIIFAQDCRMASKACSNYLILSKIYAVFVQYTKMSHVMQNIWFALIFFVPHKQNKFAYIQEGMEKNVNCN